MSGRRVLPPRPPAPGARCMPPGPLGQYSLMDETVTVDGVVYDAVKIRALLLELERLKAVKKSGW